jgi:hypothetical protein
MKSHAGVKQIMRCDTMATENFRGVEENGNGKNYDRKIKSSTAGGHHHLEAARHSGTQDPQQCFLKEINVIGASISALWRWRAKPHGTACNTLAGGGHVIHTHSIE